MSCCQTPYTTALIDDLIWDLTWHTVCQLFTPPHLHSEFSSAFLTLNCSLLYRQVHSIVTWSVKKCWNTACGEQREPAIFFFFKEQVINTAQYMALLTKTSCVWLCRFREGEVGAVRSHCSSAHPHPCCADEAAELWFMTAYLIRCSGVHLQHVGVPWVKPLISCKDTWVTSVEDFFFFLKKRKKKMQRTHFHFVLFEVLLHVVCFHSIMEPAVALTSVNYHFISH